MGFRYEKKVEEKYKELEVDRKVLQKNGESEDYIYEW
jgi:hypothetical protein